jgi:hypothetical protein
MKKDYNVHAGGKILQQRSFATGAARLFRKKVVNNEEQGAF